MNPENPSGEQDRTAKRDALFRQLCEEANLMSTTDALRGYQEFKRAQFRMVRTTIDNALQVLLATTTDPTEKARLEQVINKVDTRFAEVLSEEFDAQLEAVLSQREKE